MNPVYHQAKFINSAPHVKDAPEDTGLEVAFAGRSNAGKSSAINTLTGQKSLARISKTPGRTQLLNFLDNGNHTLCRFTGLWLCQSTIGNQKTMAPYDRNLSK